MSADEGRTIKTNKVSSSIADVTTAAGGDFKISSTGNLMLLNI